MRVSDRHAILTNRPRHGWGHVTHVQVSIFLKCIYVVVDMHKHYADAVFSLIRLLFKTPVRPFLLQTHLQQRAHWRPARECRLVEIAGHLDDHVR